MSPLCIDDLITPPVNQSQEQVAAQLAAGQDWALDTGLIQPLVPDQKITWIETKTELITYLMERLASSEQVPHERGPRWVIFDPVGFGSTRPNEPPGQGLAERPDEALEPSPMGGGR